MYFNAEAIKAKQKRVDIFNNTLEIIKDITVNGNNYYLSDIYKVKEGSFTGNISVVDNNSIDCFIDNYRKDEQNRLEKKYAILNFADFIYAGGLVLKGGSAQEECLCRATNLYTYIFGDPLYDEHKKMMRRKVCGYEFNSDAIYSKDVAVVKTGSAYNVLERLIYCDIITICAPNIKKANLNDESLYNIMKDRWARVVSIANDNNIDTLIVGAWGCGVFRCKILKL